MIGPLPSPRMSCSLRPLRAECRPRKATRWRITDPEMERHEHPPARLLTNANVQRRIDELRVEAAEQAKASLQVLIPALEEQARDALTAGRLREASTLVRRLQEI